MGARAVRDPIEQLSRAERRGWRLAARRAQKDHEADQLATLQGFVAAGTAVTGLVSSASSTLLTESVEMVIDGRRIQAHRVHRPTLAALKEALASIATVPLAAAGRYGPYWVLTFRTAAEPLVVLVDRLTILPDWGGGSGRMSAPTGPVMALAG